MPLFGGPRSAKIDFLPTARGAYFWNRVDQPEHMEPIGKDGCRVGAFLEVMYVRAVRMGDILNASFSFGHRQASVRWP